MPIEIRANDSRFKYSQIVNRLVFQFGLQSQQGAEHVQNICANEVTQLGTT